MRLQPIPKSLLPDSISVRVPKESEYRGQFEEPVTIENVRFDSAASLARSNYVFSEGSTGLIFIDSLNSAGAFEIPAGSRIELNGQDHIVVGTNIYCDYFGRVHHWEVEVA